MDEIIRMLLSMGKTKEEIAEFVGKEMPSGGVVNPSNVLKPLTRKVAGDFPLLGSRITDPTGIKNFNLGSVTDSFADQEKAWAKTFKFLREGKFNLSPLQKQNLTYNLGIFQRTKNAIKNTPEVKMTNKSNVYDLQKNLLDPNEPILGGTQSQKPIDKLKEYNVDLSDLTFPKDKGDLIKFPKKETKLSKDYDDAVFNQKATNKLQKNLNKETKDLEKINEIEELSKDLSKESDVDKILLKSEELKKPGQGKFTKAEYLIQRLENTLKDPNADPYVKKTFPGFIKELKADPDLAKNENVFKELGGDLPEDQQIVVYDDDTLDFFTQKEGPGNIKTLDKLLEDNPFLSRDEGLNLLKMEPNDQVLELTKLKFLSKKKTDNAEGGIINLAQGGMI